MISYSISTIMITKNHLNIYQSSNKISITNPNPRKKEVKVLKLMIKILIMIS